MNADNSLDDIMHPDGTMRSCFAPTDSEDDPAPCPTEGCDNNTGADGNSCAECQARDAEYRKEYERYGRREVANRYLGGWHTVFLCSPDPLHSIHPIKLGNSIFTLSFKSCRGKRASCFSWLFTKRSLIKMARKRELPTFIYRTDLPFKTGHVIRETKREFLRSPR